MNVITDDQLIVFDHHRTRGKYEEISSGSAIYPGQGTIAGMAYVSLKLTGEIAELAESYSVEDCTKEAGDVLWYIGAMHRELGVKSNDDDRMDDMVQEYGVPPINPDFIAMIAAGKLGEVVGKAMRDDDGELSPNARAEIIHHLGAIFVCVAQYLNMMDVRMSDCMMLNLEKLRDRTLRGTLQGSGDNR